MTGRAQTNQRLEPMRVHATLSHPALNVMHVRHRSRTTELAHPIATLEHLTTPSRINSITLPPA